MPIILKRFINNNVIVLMNIRIEALVYYEVTVTVDHDRYYGILYMQAN